MDCGSAHLCDLGSPQRRRVVAVEQRYAVGFVLGDAGLVECRLGFLSLVSASPSWFYTVPSPMS
jgi:hypothetical protein